MTVDVSPPLSCKPVNRVRGPHSGLARRKGKEHDLRYGNAPQAACVHNGLNNDFFTTVHKIGAEAK